MKLALLTLVVMHAWAGRLTGNTELEHDRPGQFFDKYLEDLIQHGDAPQPFTPRLECKEALPNSACEVPPSPASITFNNGALDSVKYDRPRVIAVAKNVAIATDTLKFRQNSERRVVKFKGHVQNREGSRRVRFSGFYDVQSHQLCDRAHRGANGGYCRPAASFFEPPTA